MVMILWQSANWNSCVCLRTCMCVFKHMCKLWCNTVKTVSWGEGAFQDYTGESKDEQWNLFLHSKIVLSTKSLDLVLCCVPLSVTQLVTHRAVLWLFFLFLRLSNTSTCSKIIQNRWNVALFVTGFILVNEVGLQCQIVNKRAHQLLGKQAT